MATCVLRNPAFQLRVFRTAFIPRSQEGSEFPHLVKPLVTESKRRVPYLGMRGFDGVCVDLTTMNEICRIYHKCLWSSHFTAAVIKLHGQEQLKEFVHCSKANSNSAQATHTVKLAAFLEASGVSKESCLSWHSLRGAQCIFQCLVIASLSLIFCRNSHSAFCILLKPLVLQCKVKWIHGNKLWDAE